MTERNEPNEERSMSHDIEPTRLRIPGRVFHLVKRTCRVLTSERASRLATVLQLVVLVLSVILIRNQLEQQAMLTRAANTQALVNLVSPINLQLSQNGEIAELMLRGRKGFAKEVQKREVEEDRYTTALASYLIFYENMYAQHQKKLLDYDVYVGWDKDLEAFVDRELLEKYWDGWKDLYQPAFSSRVTELIDAKRARQAKSVP